MHGTVVKQCKITQHSAVCLNLIPPYRETVSNSGSESIPESMAGDAKPRIKPRCYVAVQRGVCERWRHRQMSYLVAEMCDGYQGFKPKCLSLKTDLDRKG